MQQQSVEVMREAQRRMVMPRDRIVLSEVEVHQHLNRHQPTPRAMHFILQTDDFEHVRGCEEETARLVKAAIFGNALDDRW